MTSVRFSPQDIQHWAEFSGDRNPVHFDAEAARGLVGEKGPFVHGMLAMLPLKQAFADSLAQTKTGETWRWHAQLRRPMPISGQYRLISAKKTNGGTGFQLLSFAGGERFISASAAPQAHIPCSEGHGRFTLESQEISDMENSFRSMFPDIRQNWIGLDALLFGRYIRAHLLQFLRDQGLDSSGENSGYGRTGLLMQISHTIIAEQWALDCKDVSPHSPFTYDIEQVSTVFAEQTRYAKFQLTLYGNDRLFLVQELSLMLAHPTTPTYSPESGIHHEHLSHP